MTGEEDDQSRKQKYSSVHLQEQRRYPKLLQLSKNKHMRHNMKLWEIVRDKYEKMYLRIREPNWIYAREIYNGINPSYDTK